MSTFVGVIGLAIQPGAFNARADDLEPLPPIGLEPGDLVQDHGVGAIVPPPGIGVSADALLEDGAQELQVWTLLDGTVGIGSWGDELETEDPSPSAPGACTDDEFNHKFIAGKRFKWYFSYNWHFRSSTTPNELTVAATESALREAGKNITQSFNDCDRADFISATADYQGTTSQATDITVGGTCLTYQPNQSVTGFGDLPSGILGFTCTWVDLAFTPSFALQSDMRLNSYDYQWWVSGSCSGKYSVESVATHERGHTWSMAHVSEGDHGNLTMSVAINGKCQNAERTLGLGDMLGLEDLY